MIRVVGRMPGGRSPVSAATTVNPDVATPALGDGLRNNHLGFLETVAQSIGTIAPSGTPGLIIPVVFATAGNGTWLAYIIATIALVIVGFQINVFSFVDNGRGFGHRDCFAPFAGARSSNAGRATSPRLE